MTGDKTKFAKLELKEEGFVTYGDNNKGRILGNEVIGQLCNKGFKVMFESNNCLIYDAHGNIVLIGKRVNNIYIYIYT